MEAYAFSFKILSKLTALFRSFLLYLIELYNVSLLNINDRRGKLMIKTDTLPQFLRNKVAGNDAFGLVEGLCQLLRKNCGKVSSFIMLFSFNRLYSKGKYYTDLLEKIKMRGKVRSVLKGF